MSSLSDLAAPYPKRFSMARLTRRLQGWIGGLTAGVAVGCSSAATLPGQPESAGVHLPSGIAQLVRPTVAIQSLTAEQTNETVHIEGTVVQQAPLLTGGLYQVQDDSGTVWVLSNESVPAVAATVNVVGIVEVEAIAVEGIDISDFYLRETSRTLTAPDTPAAATDEAAPNPDESPALDDAG
ncbi:hypothetical protein [Leptolyngbya iicbica]|nr:hypothetical protein [Leptolyngbya sp. LK]